MTATLRALGETCAGRSLLVLAGADVDLIVEHVEVEACPP
jgi:hypothetical protein